MATTSSSPTSVESNKNHHHHHHHRHQNPHLNHDQTSALTPRSLSVRAKTATLPSSQRILPSNNRVPARPAFPDDTTTQLNYVTSNPGECSKRSTNRDTASSPRAESRQYSASRHQHSSSRNNCYPSQMTTVAEKDAGLPPATRTQESRFTSKSGKSRTTIPTASGNWVLGKTIGAGSMGKVKLARKMETGEQVAVKIVPRGSTEESPQQSKADRERADHSKEVRTAREAAIVTLLDHPYICSMKDVLRTTNHWYMLFEYVNGGQMLDYIISHGRLKEKQARKFSRQIASALDYCHRNSIVHRDLKIENILISKTGDIKIIDFGLSNMFNPRDHLKTFCGSLYFAAPELLQAKRYTGPEVDVWSFGIVLYVLVCGKVPFDDQNMPALHAKIKKGVVDYPNWISLECKNLISRMLVTDSRQRATLQEIMIHPWMLKGFGSVPENHLPIREILHTPLDSNVIQAMTGFNFGPPETIHSQLTEILESQDYMKAVRQLAQEREAQESQKDFEKKRGFGFDFYKRKSYSNSRDALSAPNSEGVLPFKNDPVNAFHPLISVYFLVKEKQERDRLTLNNSNINAPRPPIEIPLQMTEIVPPKSAYTNLTTYEMPGENVTGGRSRPRARTHGEDELATTLASMKKVGSPELNSPVILEPSPGHARKGSTAAGILRRFSTRRRKETPEKSHPSTVTPHSPFDKNVHRKSLSIRRTHGKKSEVQISGTNVGGNHSCQSSSISPLKSTETSVHSPNILARSSSVKSDNIRIKDGRGGVTDSKLRSYKESKSANVSKNSIAQGESIRHKNMPKISQTQKATNRTKSLGHARRDSIQARRAKREVQEISVPEQVDTDIGETSSPSNEGIDHVEQLKPVYLKGLFSVSTTSTKPVPVICSDIIRVLRQHSVEYKEVRGGFHCRHTPSIDLKKVHDMPPSAHNNFITGHRRKISLGGLISGSFERDRDDIRDIERSSQLFRLPTRSHHQPRGTSITNSDISDESVHRYDRGSSAKFAGETSTHVQSDLGESMILEFEIFIVKIPLLSLHGIQFKRLVGGTWQYKNMADQILRELRL
ncbi:Protein kinase kin1 [Golovinomyces cichoracearum]|uniref:non-specific serine/threonine protein kinase n=1 Tax=Golovinomyces cichoracearum TaxID=62708 RepID=A0A420JA04_9PEZI|nr:Protein kinase kin1 [Golovinomyces cichoracearum]